MLAVVTKRSGGQKQEEALRLLFSRVLALPLTLDGYKIVGVLTDELTYIDELKIKI